jgi:hypothetical protein
VKTKLTVLVAIALALPACAAAPTAASNAEALARGAAVKTLAAGKLDVLPTGPVYIRFIRFVSPPQYTIQSKQHVASFVYVETGVHELTLAGQAPIDLTPGQATFHQSATHTHFNPETATSVWYSIAIWPSSARGTARVDKIAEAPFESPDIDRTALPDVAYAVVLRQVTLAAQGTSGAHRFGGLAAFFVLSGSVTIKSEHRAPVTLSGGQGAAFLPDVALQDVNAASDPAEYLEFVSTPVGKDFEVPLKQPPAA